MNENVYFECRKRAAIHNERLNSRAGAAEILGISESTLAHYELGITKNIPVDVVVMMAEVYNAPELKCIYCKSEYEYDFISYGHLGNFRCTHCGYHRPKAEYAVTNVVERRANGSSVVLMVNGSQYMAEVNLPAMYNIYNAIGAVAAVTEMGLGTEAAISAIADFKCGFGRMEQFDLGKAGTKMMLVKNPAGCNQVIEFLENIKEKFILIVCLNDRGADGTDVSWIWDADFEGLTAMSGYIDRVIVSGDRAEDMAVRIKYAGVAGDHISTERDYERLVQWISQQDKPVFIMPTYTAMLELREAVIRRCGGDEFWV